MRRQRRERVILVVHNGHRRGLDQLDALAVGRPSLLPRGTLLDVQDPADLAAWLAANDRSRRSAGQRQPESGAFKVFVQLGQVPPI